MLIEIVTTVSIDTEVIKETARMTLDSMQDIMYDQELPTKSEEIKFLIVKEMLNQLEEEN